ncbi:efflux RND transporter periplasmic adaptor subunit [uncultured Winogradskyella sp.]|uniref:efflux RND transporter periplasmic adaptor subunit n=1 Tax=uncultured Winogradskyella sp. TaxID=395353 RepID=UPI00261A2209|nr:efflux RND transporter periplasmic adaptor subunit [uncultured Winogradskyella sp.]
MKPIYKIVVLSSVLTILGCRNSNNETKINSQQTDDRIIVSKEQFKQNNMQLGSIEDEAFPMSIKVNGMIDVPPENKAVVNSITGGYIKTIPLLVGDVVKKGQKLVTIENPEFVEMQQEYMEIKEQLNYLKSEYERQSIMFKENIISQKVFLKAESEYKTATAKYNGLRKQLTLLNINPTSVEQGNITSVVNLYAPIGGSITEVNVSKGTYVSPSTSILEIIDNSHIHIELSVFEKDILNIKKDQKISFSIPEASEKSYEAIVHLVGTSIDENRTIKVHAHPLDESQHFLTGMFVNAKIITDTRNSIALPEDALVESDDNYYALLLDEETNDSYFFKQVKIKKGTSYNGFSEINDTNLNSTDKFLVNGAFNLINME